MERSVRLQARSAELISNSVVTMRSVVQYYQIVAEGRALRTRDKALANSRTSHVWIAGVQALPLTPPMLLELADEFRVLAGSANTSDSRAAFQDLAFRYIALAGGCDSNQMRSRMLH